MMMFDKMEINLLKGTGTVRPLLALVHKRTQLREELRHMTLTSEENHCTQYLDKIVKFKEKS